MEINVISLLLNLGLAVYNGEGVMERMCDCIETENDMDRSAIRLYDCFVIWLCTG